MGRSQTLLPAKIKESTECSYKALYAIQLLDVHNNNLWLVYGGYDLTYTPSGSRKGFSHFKVLKIQKCRSYQFPR